MTVDVEDGTDFGRFLEYDVKYDVGETFFLQDIEFDGETVIIILKKVGSVTVLG